MVIPGSRRVPRAVTWIDRGPERDPRNAGRCHDGWSRWASSRSVVLTTLGWRDSPPTVAAAGNWTLAKSAGARSCRTRRARNAIRTTAWPIRSRRCAPARGTEWIGGHAADPEMIAPWLARGADARRTSAKRPRSSPTSAARRGSRTRGSEEPLETVGHDLRALLRRLPQDRGRRRRRMRRISRKPGRSTTPATLRRWIVDPESVDPDADMPSFGDRLSAAAARRDRGVSRGAEVDSL